MSGKPSEASIADTPTIELGIGGWRVPLHSHIAYLWKTDEGFARAMGYFEVGLRGADHCVLLADSHDRERMLAELGRRIDLRSDRVSTRLTVLERLADHRQTLDSTERAARSAVAAGAQVVRIGGSVGWGRADGASDAELYLTESSFTEFASRCSCVVLCMHELSSLSSLAFRYGMLGTHPQIFEGDLISNPFAVLPDRSPNDAIGDIVERLSREQHEREESRQRREALQAIFDNIPVMISVSDSSGRLLLVNREWQQVLGWSREEARRVDVLAEAYPDPERRREVIEFMDKAERRWQDFRTRTKDGRVIDTSWLRVALSDGTRIGFGLDLTERKRAEGALRESQELLRLVLETLPVGVVVTNQVGDIVLVNSASKRIWGGEITSGPDRWVRSKGSWHGSGERIPPEAWASVRALKDGQTSLNELIDIDTYDGKRKTMQNSAAPIRNTEGAIVGALIVNEDVTERVRAEEGLRKSEQELRSLSERLRNVREEEWARISREIHDEIGQALTALQMDLAWVQKHLTSTWSSATIGPKLDSMASLIDQTAEAMQRIATELRPRILDELGLGDAVEWLVRDFERRTGISCEIFTNLDDASLDSDLATAAFRILQEALTNVTRHAHASHVEVRLRLEERRLTLEVRDDGQGIPAARISDPRSVGLVGMRERARTLGGEVSIRGDPRGGTLVTLSLPR